MQYSKLIGFDELARRYNLRPFKYSIYEASVALGATVMSSVTITENTAFAICRIQPRSHVIATPGTHAQANLQITDNGTARNFFDRALPTYLLGGWYQGVLNLGEFAPYVVAGNSSLTATITNTDAANILTFWLILWGVNLYTKETGAPVQNVVMG